MHRKTYTKKTSLFSTYVFKQCLRYIITDIIGKEEGLGVENLRGSGTIAGETSQAYKEVITISMVRPNIYSSSDILQYARNETPMFILYAIYHFVSMVWSSSNHLRVFIFPLGHMSCHRNWCVSCTSRTKSNSSGKLPYHPDWGWGTKQGVEFHICIHTLHSTVSYLCGLCFLYS